MKAAETAISVTVIDVVLFFQSVILSACPGPRLSPASRAETFSSHTNRLLLIVRHSQGSTEKFKRSTQLHTEKKKPAYSGNIPHTLTSFIILRPNPYKRCACMATRKRITDIAMTLDFIAVHRTLTRCGHRTHTALWAVMVTSVQADSTPEMYTNRFNNLQDALLCRKMSKWKACIIQPVAQLLYNNTKSAKDNTMKKNRTMETFVLCVCEWSQS